jgi:hypothetical protein
VRLIDLTGKRIGKLLVLAREPNNCAGGTRWRVECDCGSGPKIVERSNLLRALSCGCVDGKLKHGAARRGKRTPEHYAWTDMVQRGTNRSKPSYYSYARQGISVCDGFRKFSNFLSEIGYRPSPGHSVDRKDNAGHYSCGHCEQCVVKKWPPNVRWATAMEQASNTSKTRMLTHGGITMCVTAWSREIGVPAETLFYRLNTGRSVEETLTTPAGELS